MLYRYTKRILPFSLAAIPLLLPSLIILSASPTVRAAADFQHGNCNGGMACFSWNGSRWFVAGNNLGHVDAQINLNGITFGSNTPVNPAQPVSSNNPIRADNAISVCSASPLEVQKKLNSGAPQAQSNFRFSPQNMRWDGTGFVMNDYPNLRLHFEIGFSDGGCANPQGKTRIQGDTTVQMPASMVAYNQKKRVYFNVTVHAEVIGEIKGDIHLANKDIFSMTFEGNHLGKISIAGSTRPITPPKAKTCESPTTQNQTFDLPSISIDRIAAIGNEDGGVTREVRLRCPSNVRIKMVVKDANDHNSRNSYLTSTGTAANAKVRLYFENSLITMLKEFSKISQDGQNTLSFTAKYYNAVGNISPGSVTSQAILTLNYE